MANSVRRWLAGGGGKVSAAVGGFYLVLIAVGVASALRAGISSRVQYLCDGESPRPCACYRDGEEPAGFVMNRISKGPAAGVGTALLVTFVVGLMSIAGAVAHRKVGIRSGTNAESSGIFSLLLSVGLALIAAAALIWISSFNPAPCDDQGALGLAGIWPSRCPW